MCEFGANMRVAEIKGILSALEDKIYKVKRNLAFDNIDNLTIDIPEMRMMLDRIEAKVDEVENDKEENDDYI